MKFSQYVFRIAGIYGLIVILPIYFIESDLFHGTLSPRADFYYGFAGVALAWQFAFFIIASDVVKYRLLMIPSVMEKVFYTSAVVVLFINNRLSTEILIFAGMDIIFSALFVMAFIKTKQNLTKIDHLGIAVPELEKFIELYKTMGFTYEGREKVDEQKVETAFFKVGESHLELLAATHPDSAIAKFIKKNNGKGGIAHVAIGVTGIQARLDELKAKGFQLIDEKPQLGAHGSKIAFIHPKSTGGVLLELCEKP